MDDLYNSKQMGRLWYITHQIHSFCKQKKWTQTDLARHAHVKPRKIQRLEDAFSIDKVNLDTLYRIADALDVPITEFLKS